ncbi:DUF5927 domain-containing protein [Paenirhodobacter populi]|uniref:Peptide O-xylosyltransferase n=2 Tax=Paenirhodobacter populi TaxID=2306993 RepID=A0A443IVD7_9RHOB|nr:glycosyl transferase [Sinirhodobacter populi]
MSFGVVMICHTALDRVAQVARFWAAGGVPVAIHLDAAVPDVAFDALRRSLADVDAVGFTRRYRCAWGTWSLVAAAQAGAEMILSRAPHVGHAYLTSGACLPLRPVADLADYLAACPDTDFIESATTADTEWTIGGLDIERFTLRFPFGWKTQRRLFDAYVDLQRRLGFRRRIPSGITPHLGSQWWCLSRKTLSAILTDPDRGRYDRYFRRVWIPDESYFQTLARRHSDRIESRSLTLARFDALGKPYVFYDDHQKVLRRSGFFVARKIWPGAEGLYRGFLSPDLERSRAEPDPMPLERLFRAATERRLRGRPGLYMQSRLPRRDREQGKTAAPYSVFQGFGELFEDFGGWLAQQIPADVHGHLFAPGRAEFAGGQRGFRGGLSDSARLRDYDPRAFLTSLIWNSRGTRQCFLFGPRDAQEINWFIATDPQAQISVISGAWVVPLFRAGGDFAAIRQEATRLHRIETRHLEILRSVHTQARLRIWTLADFLDDPATPLQAIVDEISPRRQQPLTTLPQMVDLTGFGGFLQKLRNQGLQPRLIGNFPIGHEAMLRGPVLPAARNT